MSVTWSWSMHGQHRCGLYSYELSTAGCLQQFKIMDMQWLRCFRLKMVISHRGKFCGEGGACSQYPKWSLLTHATKFSKLWPHHNFSASPGPDNWMCKTSSMVILVHRNLSLNFSSLAICCVWQPLTLDNFHMQSTPSLKECEQNLHWMNAYK